MSAAVLWAVPATGAEPDAVVWEETCCLLCGSESSDNVEDIADFRHEGTRCTVVRCRECGLTYTNPRPSAETIGRFYVNYEPYHACGLPAGEVAHAPFRFCKPPFWKPYHPQKHGWPLIGRGRLLDFGCGAGAFLERMHRQGWDVTGVDASPEMVDEIQSKLQLRALVGTLPHPELEPESFDAISMWHALEHVHQPAETLAEAWRLLAPGGKLVIGVPNVASSPRRWFGPAWYGWSLPHHLTHFAPRTLREMVSKAGFRVERTMLPGNTYWLRRSAEAAHRLASSDKSPHWMTNRFLSRQVARWLAWTRQSDEMLLVAKKV
jgi:2-polyprenyl-3-methyl-5-hydroxy-6-metoxy-1,4-benzoquinol methylase